MKTKLFIFLIIIASVAKQSQAQTPYVAIPDSNFVHYLKTIVPTAFKGDSLNRSSTLVTTTTDSIIVHGAGITNLSGIQYFTSLTYLNCNNNTLTSLPTLPNSLITLWCFFNSITTLPTLPNSLQSLWCQWNSLTSLPPLPNSLIDLRCQGNNIVCFPTFPNSIDSLTIDPNPYNCLPNHIAAMNSTDLATPLCAAGNSNGCPLGVAGIEQIANINEEVSIYPNPTKDMLNVVVPHLGSTILITDIIGNTVKQVAVNSNQLSINVADLNEGVYNVSISNGAGVINKRVVIVR